MEPPNFLSPRRNGLFTVSYFDPENKADHLCRSEHNRALAELALDMKRSFASTPFKKTARDAKKWIPVFRTNPALKFTGAGSEKG